MLGVLWRASICGLTMYLPASVDIMTRFLAYVAPRTSCNHLSFSGVGRLPISDYFRGINIAIIGRKLAMKCEGRAISGGRSVLGGAQHHFALASLLTDLREGSVQARQWFGAKNPTPDIIKKGI